MTPAMIGVEAGGGLVEEDHLGLGGDGAGEGGALLHPARQLGRVEVGGAGGQAHAGEGLDGAGAGLGAGHPRLQVAEGHVLPDGERVEERAALEEHPEAARKASRVEAGHVLARRGGWCRRRADEAQDALEEHRLARCPSRR
jgi:hypothetical protein